MQLQLMNVSGYELQSLDPNMTIGQLLQMKHDRHAEKEAEMLEELRGAKEAYAGKYFRIKYREDHTHYLFVEDVVEVTEFRTRITGTEIKFTKGEKGRFEISENPLTDYASIENFFHTGMREISQKGVDRMRISSLPVFHKK